MSVLTHARFWVTFVIYGGLKQPEEARHFVTVRIVARHAKTKNQKFDVYIHGMLMVKSIA